MTRSYDPRVRVVAQAISDRNYEDSLEDLTPGSLELAEVAIDALDKWLVYQYHEAKRAGLPQPRLYGHRFCDCTELIGQIMRPKRDT